MILKSDPQTPLSGLLLARLVAELDLPPGVFSHLVGGADVGRHLVAHRAVAHVTFTGSTAVGREIARAATENFTRVTLELGGKSAGIVLNDAEPGAALPQIFGATMGHAGQTCTTSSRLLVPAARYGEWTDALTAAFSSYVVGDPTDPRTQIPPLVSDRHRAHVEGMVQTARDEGATILTGGSRPPELTRGFFFEPTLIADAHAETTVVREEVFGPVITLHAYDDDDDAVAIANRTPYGLANSIYTRDLDRAARLAPRLRSGTVTINRGGACMIQPFGGFGQSGIGREGGREGLDEFLEFQQVVMPQQ